MFNTLKQRLLTAGMSAVLVVAATHMILPHEGQVVNEKGQHIAYVDIVGVPTTCWGLTGKDMHGNQIKKGNKYTQQECEESLVKELTSYNQSMKKYVKVPLSPGEEIAYTSFVWNLGETNWRNSTLLKKLNSGDRDGACAQLLLWNKSTFNNLGAISQQKNGEQCTQNKNGSYSCTVKGLTNRRQDEYKTCMGKNSDVNVAIKELSRQGYKSIDPSVGEK